MAAAMGIIMLLMAGVALAQHCDLKMPVLKRKKRGSNG
jgi:hypothetical protein